MRWENDAQSSNGQDDWGLEAGEAVLPEGAASDRGIPQLDLRALLVEAYKQNRDGTITVMRRGSETRVPITLRQGRVVALTHPATSASGVTKILVQVGLITEKALAKAQAESAKRGIYIEDYLVQRGIVSRGTIAAVRERVALELLMDLLLAKDLEISFSWTPQRGVRDMFVLPIPYLLKEAQRRVTLGPLVRRSVPSLDRVFVKATYSAGKEPPPRWEDLNLSASERQVYFFVDGRRTVADLILATSQTEFEVLAALHNLLEMRLIVPVERAVDVGAVAHAGQSAMKRVFGLAVVGALLLTLIYFLAASGISLPSGGRSDTILRQVIRAAPVQRLLGAMRAADLYGDVPVASFDDLVAAGLAMRADRIAATLLLPLEGDPSQKHFEETQE